MNKIKRFCMSRYCIAFNTSERIASKRKLIALFTTAVAVALRGKRIKTIRYRFIINLIVLKKVTE